MGDDPPDLPGTANENTPPRNYFHLDMSTIS